MSDRLASMIQPAHIIREYQPTDQAAVVRVWFNAGKREYTYLAGWRKMTLDKATTIFCEVILRDCKPWVAPDVEYHWRPDP